MSLFLVFCMDAPGVGGHDTPRSVKDVAFILRSNVHNDSSHVYIFYICSNVRIHLP